MITFDQLGDFFEATRQLRSSGRASWSINSACRWSYFFFDTNCDKLRPLAQHLESVGYDVVGFLEPEASADVANFYLRVDRVELHTPPSLHELNQELYRVASHFGVAYDGMDVGPVEGP